MKLIFSAVAALLLCGCASIKHSRQVVGPDGKVVAIETEKAWECCAKGEISKLKVSTKDGPYSHTFAADAATVAGDGETLKAVIEATGAAVGNGIGAAAKTAVKP